MLGGQTLLPAGTRIRGIVTSISRAKRFALFRGEAYLNLAFRSVEVDGRLIPVQMSILDVMKPSTDGEGSRRKDVDVTEGQLLQQKHDIKGDIVATHPEPRIIGLEEKESLPLPQNTPTPAPGLPTRPEPETLPMTNGHVEEPIDLPAW